MELGKTRKPMQLFTLVLNACETHSQDPGSNLASVMISQGGLGTNHSTSETISSTEESQRAIS